MPRRKKLPKVSGYQGSQSNNQKLLVQKSNPLIALSETGMTLAEFKILDAYLGRINSHKPDKRLVHFEKGELEKILGVTRILKDDLLARISSLNKNPVIVPNDSKPNGFAPIWLFERADCYTDENGLWYVDLMCTESAMEYIFNIEDIGYIRYRLKNVINLTSRYSYILFLYLVDTRTRNPFRKTWSIKLDELKALLGCTSEAYKQYYRFNDLILKKCHKELCEKTSVNFEYMPIKCGRTVSAVEFTVDKLEEFEELDNLTDNEYINHQPKPASLESETATEFDYDTDLSVLLDKAFKGEFPSDNIQKLHDLVCEAVPENDNKARVQYFLERYSKMEAYSPNKKGRLNYLKTIIENEIQSKGDSSSYDLSDYEKFARDYDFSDAPWNVKTGTEKT